jgi:broad specificity phosphatase PhoE
LNTKKIYIVRHGQTDFNLRGIVQGSGVDSHLNDFGWSQTRAFFDKYNHIPFEKVYTSALTRTVQSVDLFIKAGMPHERLPELNEISWGKKEGQPITPEEDAYYHYMLAQWRKGETHLRIEGGESPDDVVKRMSPGINYILSQPEKTILICMHGRAIRILLCMLLNYPLRSMDMFEHENACLYVLNYSGTMFSVELYNDTAHLSELKKTAQPIIR